MQNVTSAQTPNPQPTTEEPQHYKAYFIKSIMRRGGLCGVGRCACLLSAWTAGLLLAQLRSSLPDLRIEPAEWPALPQGLHATELRLTTPHRSLRTDLADEQSQALLSSIQELSTSCMVVVQWCIGPWVRREPTHLPTAAEKRRANAEILPVRFIQRSHARVICTGPQRGSERPA